jgi:drug/metabolite transporter (DMT)-like permease
VNIVSKAIILGTVMLFIGLAFFAEAEGLGKWIGAMIAIGGACLHGVAVAHVEEDKS